MNDELLTLIDGSILSDADKKTLNDLLNAENDSDDFYQKFNELIIAEVRRRGAKYADLIEQYEADLFALDEEMDTKRLNQEQLLDEALEKLDADDLERRTSLFDGYYSALAEIDAEHEGRLQAAISGLLQKLM
jgi:hypothetical protein